VDHGIAPAGEGTIRISCHRAGDCLSLLIANTGRCLDAKDHARIDAALSEDSGESNHLGLANIISRLRLLYGSRAILTIDGGPNKETVVEILVPQDSIAEAGGVMMNDPEGFKDNPEDHGHSESPPKKGGY
jgi:sensor histidine kinase YesM